MELNTIIVRPAIQLIFRKRAFAKKVTLPDAGPSGGTMDPTTKAAMIAEMNEEVKGMTPAEFNKYLLDIELASDDSYSSDPVIEGIYQRGKKLGIQYTDWAMDAELLDENLPAELLEGAKYIGGDNNCCDACGGVRPLNGQGMKPKCYEDLWLRIDKMRGIGRTRKTNTLKCDHRFIERIYRKDNCIMVSFGS